MSCYHPLKAFPVGLTENGKIDYKIRSYSVNHIELHEKNGVRIWVDCYDDFVSSYSLKTVKSFREIPCGKCIGCRLDYSRSWADRCMLEKSYHDYSFFLTLTYDDDHLIKNSWLNSDTGECGETATLVKADFQKFMKRLRKKYDSLCDVTGEDSHLMYYACGEYGSQSARPHYHAIVFGLHLTDLKPYKRNSQGDWYYTSEWLQQLWPFGYVVVADVTWDTCAYVARYIMKKQKGDAADVYEKYNFLPEFTLMSLKPAIGLHYYEEHRDDLYSKDHVSIPTLKGGMQVKPCRYFDRKYEIDFPDEMAYIKSKRESFAKDFSRLKQMSTSKSYIDMLADEEYIRTNRIKALKRKEI